MLSTCRISDAGDGESEKVEFTALWDTGATQSAISQKVVDTLNLTQESSIEQVKHAFGSANNIPVYHVNITLPNRVELLGVPVSGDLYGQNVLIGMDIISHGDLAITSKDGKTQFTFRFPSIADIDFVKEDNREIRKAKRSASRHHKKQSGKRRRQHR